ncbi:MAG: ABC transporter ATP-binding protein [Marinilabiliales bacterium]|nr:MAG: ABC transporter ATP-binding protein [Marinilabiliales bacterium]
MQNIQADKIKHLKDQAGKLYNAFNDADKWVFKNLKYEEKDRVLLDIKHSRRIVKKIQNSIDSKPVFALFGASQVGKSYLVKNLLSIDGAPLQIHLGDKKYDFLKDINPPGVGAESTGVVTRFTIDQPFLNPEFPVRIKLLHPKDLIIILCDGFFTDFKEIKNYPKAEDFIKLVESLEAEYAGKPQVQKILDELDVLDVQEYFIKNFYKSSHYVQEIDQANYWLRVGAIINSIPTEEWPNVFSILWNNVPEINELFTDLNSELAKANYTDCVYAPEWSILRGQGEILDVQRLKELKVNKKKIEVQNANQENLDLSLCYLSALSKELTLGVDSAIASQKAFLNNTDLLDFPGARSRLELTLKALSESAVQDIYLRGKVAYLFNKYSADFEINNLLFCQKDEQLEVTELSSLLNEWISRNIGKDAGEREKSISSLPVSPLFIIFTFFNNQLAYDTTNDYKEDIGYKWDTRFNRFFQEGLVTKNFNWDVNWTESKPLFSNFYMLRDFKYSEDSFKGFVETGREEGIQPDREEFFTKLRSSFLADDFVQKHFENPELAWDSSAVPNMDGSKLIIENLEPAANNFIKTQNYINQLQTGQTNVQSLLKRFYHSDNLHEKRVEAMKSGTRLQLDLNKVFGKDPKLFNTFIDRLLLSEVDVYNLFHDNLVSTREVKTIDEAALIRSQFPQLSSENTYQKNIELLQEALSFSNTAEVEQFLKEEEIDLKKIFQKKEETSATLLVDKLFDLWSENIKIENFELLISKGLTKNTVIEIKELILSTMKHLKLHALLSKYVEAKTHGIEIDRDSEEYMAAVCTNYFNDFVVNIGLNFMQSKMIEDVKSYSEALGKEIDKLILPQPEPAEEDLIRLFDFHGANENGTMGMTFNPMIESYNNFITKIKIALLSNCGFVDYDIMANSQLKGIMDTISGAKISL